MPYPTKRGRCLAPRELPFTADSPDPLGTLAVSNARTAPETIWKALAALAVSDAAAANSTAANYTPKALAALAVAERHIPRSLRFARDRGRSATPLRRERASPFQSTRHRTAPLATAPKPHRSHTPPQPTALLAPVARFARFRRCVTPPSHGTVRGGPGGPHANRRAPSRLRARRPARGTRECERSEHDRGGWGGVRPAGAVLSWRTERARVARGRAQRGRVTERPLSRAKRSGARDMSLSDRERPEGFRRGPVTVAAEMPSRADRELSRYAQRLPSRGWESQNTDR
jgi:hypothetical protein